MKKCSIIILLSFCVLAFTYGQNCGDNTGINKLGELEDTTNIKQETMKIGIILETKEYEKAWNAFRFACTAKRQGYEVKVFLMGEAVECEELTHEKYNIKEQLKQFVDLGGEIMACGTCLKSRHLQGTESCPLSTMVNCVDMVAWADKIVTF